MDKLRYRLTKGALRALGAMPLGALYALTAPAGWVLRHVVKYRRKVIRRNLCNSFPELGDKELRNIERGFYRHLTDTLAESVKLFGIGDAELARRMRIVNPEMVNDALAAGQPVVLMLGHVGNWEWVPQLIRSIDVPGVPFGEIYRPMHDPVWGRIIDEMRGRWGVVHKIPQKEAVKDILRLNKQGAWIVGFLADQRPNGQNLNHWYNFLGQSTAFSVGAERIGLHTGAKFVYADIRQESRGHYSLTYREIVPADGTTVMEGYIRMLEATIRRQPEQWLWSHNRWKYAPPANAGV